MLTIQRCLHQLNCPSLNKPKACEVFDSLKITTSYLSFYCFKVLFLNLKRNFRESYVFHCLVIKVLNLPSLRQLVYFITFISACQVLFLSFFRGILMFVCRSQATCLLYHMFVSLSTIIFVFFKTFQIVYLEETIPCDSLVRIPL